jgi:hypothetical protein
MKTELEGRTKEFSVRIVKFIRTFSKPVDGIEMGRQLLESGTSVGRLLLPTFLEPRYRDVSAFPLSRFPLFSFCSREQLLPAESR